MLITSGSVRRMFVVAFAAMLVAAPAGAQPFNDDFERADGPVDGWTVYQGQWDIVAGGLQTTVAGAAQETESWIWAGDPAVEVVGDFRASFNVNFVTPGPEVGNHGGIMFFASVPTLRWAEEMNGYTIDWLGNGSGFRLIRWDAGAFTVLVGSTPEITEPPADWSVEVSGDLITLTAGGQTVFEFSDGTYRDGHFGLWGYGTGEQIVFDNIAVSFDAVQTPVMSPAGLLLLAAFMLACGVAIVRRSSRWSCYS